MNLLGLPFLGDQFRFSHSHRVGGVAVKLSGGAASHHQKHN